MSAVTPRKLRETIAAVLRDGMTRVQINEFCAEDLALTPPTGVSEDDLVFYSKFEYVKALLTGKSLAELLIIATQVSEEVGAPELVELVQQARLTGVAGELKNLIFAADGPKPKLGFRDAINNDIVVLENEQYCLVYDRHLGPAGLTWRDLTEWWAEREGLTGAPERHVWTSLYQRLVASLANEAEECILRNYVQRYRSHGSNIPALIPQVYLHYDPSPQQWRRGSRPSIPRQRMDFLLLMPNRVRIVIECDGIQHYSNEHRQADPRRYAEMVAEDRELRLRGYEVYRFGGHELRAGPASERLLTEFFDALAFRHSPQTS
ncbi:hypothetical protein [Microbispora sp. KK1-11]|uniref:hypothetical protein n=1 Tax=Microbispora sp. KK1-11 TaxID=2053005 RepID=UPI001157C0D5|nr:hypothetical protein [Microbispora sp. KK1-11]TQS24119.1 hypothetical protein FLW16_36140 [Microbispora sp. KK1-11]